MKNITIKKNSWHYWVASNPGGWSSWRETDFCDYVRRVILGLFLLSLCLFAILLYLWSGYDWVVWVHGVLSHAAHEHMPKFARLFVTVSVIAILIGFCFVAAFGVEHLRSYLIERAYQRRQLKSQQPSFAAIPKEPSFLQHAYRSMKDKMCFRMNIVD
jgi:hypothetical protein